MNLTTVIKISRQEFEDQGYDEIQRGDIMMHFMRDELNFTPKDFAELLSTDSTMVNEAPVIWAEMGRFFVWYYINYIIDHVTED